MNSIQKKNFLIKQKAFQHCFALCERLNFPYSKLKESYYRFIERQMLPIFEEAYATTLKNKPKVVDSKQERYVWVMWWQGLDKAPNIVKNNIEIMEQIFGNRVKIINHHNIDNYVQISPMLKGKFKSGIITQQTWSDIVRSYLLNQYGGIWIDSTVIVSRNILHLPRLFERDFISVCSENNKNINVSHENWTSWFIGGSPKAPIFSFLQNFYENYFKQFDFILDYFLIDYAIQYFYSKNTEFRKEIKSQKRDWHALYFSDNLYKPISEVNTAAFRDNMNYCVQKISYKVNQDKLKPDSLYTQILNHNLNGN